MPKTKPAKGEKKPRDGARTRRLIFDAAFDEFTDKGLAGARMDAIAERAGVNVRAIYQHFDSKDGLYEAVFGDSFTGRHEEVLAAIDEVVQDPDTVRNLLPKFHEFLCGNPAFTRLMVWDALTAASGDPAREIVAADVRGGLYRREIAQLERAQRSHGSWSGLDPDLLLIALMGLAIYPHATAPMTQLITGLSSDSPEFRSRWNDFLGTLSAAMASGDSGSIAGDEHPSETSGQDRILRIAGRALARGGLVTAYGHVSMRLDDATFLVTAPMALGLITHERGTVVPIDGPLPEGVLGEVRAHQAIYRSRSDVSAVARFISPAVRALSTMGLTARPLDGFGSYFSPGPPLWDDPQLIRDDERAMRLAETLGDAPAVVMRGNGAITVADSLQKAVVLARYLEDSSAVDLAVRASGEKPRILGPDEAAARGVWNGDLVERMWAYMTNGDGELKGAS